MRCQAMLRRAAGHLRLRPGGGALSCRRSISIAHPPPLNSTVMRMMTKVHVSITSPGPSAYRPRTDPELAGQPQRRAACWTQVLKTQLNRISMKIPVYNCNWPPKGAVQRMEAGQTLCSKQHVPWKTRISAKRAADSGSKSAQLSARQEALHHCSQQSRGDWSKGEEGRSHPADPGRPAATAQRRWPP